MPEEYYSTDSVLELPIDKRNCLTKNERDMNYGIQYSFSNCMEECRAQIVLEACGCIPYFLPNNGNISFSLSTQILLLRKILPGTHKTCKPDKIRCVKTQWPIFAGSVMGNNSKNIEKLTESEEFLKQKCNCLPNCQNYIYIVDETYNTLNRQNTFSSLSFFKDIEMMNQTLVHVYFNDLVATRYRKDVYSNWLVLLAAFGGLLGLFLGFSMITGLEFLYFLTLRVFFDQMI